MALIDAKQILAETINRVNILDFFNVNIFFKYSFKYFYITGANNERKKCS